MCSRREPIDKSIDSPIIRPVPEGFVWWSWTFANWLTSQRSAKSLPRMLYGKKVDGRGSSGFYHNKGNVRIYSWSHFVSIAFRELSKPIEPGGKDLLQVFNQNVIHNLVCRSSLTRESTRADLLPYHTNKKHQLSNRVNIGGTESVAYADQSCLVSLHC
jgi:hypothetical protein